MLLYMLTPSTEADFQEMELNEFTYGSNFVQSYVNIE
jgi:hypothetical protein